MVDISANDTIWNDSSSHSSSSLSPSLMDIPDNQLIPIELLQSLKKHSLFQRANNEEFIDKLSRCIHIRAYSPRDVIVVEGEQAKAMFFLLKGSLNVCSADFERIYATLQKGACFGEIGILYSMPRTATVIASTKCIVATITAEEVKALLPQYPEVEKILRFEAEERLELLKKSKYINTAERAKVPKETTEEISSAHRLLKNVPYFKNCPEDFLHIASLKVEPRHYVANELIFERGDEGKELFFIINGKILYNQTIPGKTFITPEIGTVEVTNVDVAGSDPMVTVERLTIGDYFGDVAVVLNVPRIADVRTVTPTQVYVLKKSQFLSIIDDYRDLQEYFRIMAETSLNNLKSKASLLCNHDNKKDTPNDRTSEQAVQKPVIKPESVCNTTSDQDPTIPVTKTDVLKSKETRRRRGSVAIWSDPNLVMLANRHLKAPKEESKLKEDVINHNTATTKPLDNSRLSQLNEDVLAHILNYLDFVSLVRFGATSKKFNNFIKTSERILQTIDLSYVNKKINDDALRQIALLVNARVKQVNMSQCYYVTDNGFQPFIEKLTKMETLDLNSCWLLTDKSLSLLGVSCPALVNLNLSNCRKFSDIGIFKLLDEKRSRDFLQLKSLSLSYCKKISDMTMSYLAEFCSQTLESLDIQRCTRISDQGFAKWAEVKFNQLAYVNLTDCSFLTDFAMSYLTTAAPNIKSLLLSFCCALSDDAIVEGLSRLSFLENLDASFCGAAVSDTSIDTLVKSIPGGSMDSLNLRGCVRITDNSINSINQLVQLKSLNISQCPGISPKGKELIKNSKNIHKLIV